MDFVVESLFIEVVGVDDGFENCAVFDISFEAVVVVWIAGVEGVDEVLEVLLDRI